MLVKIQSSENEQIARHYKGTTMLFPESSYSTPIYFYFNFWCFNFKKKKIRPAYLFGSYIVAVWLGRVCKFILHAPKYELFKVKSIWEKKDVFSLLFGMIGDFYFLATESAAILIMRIKSIFSTKVILRKCSHFTQRVLYTQFKLPTFLHYEKP